MIDRTPLFVKWLLIITLLLIPITALIFIWNPNILTLQILGTDIVIYATCYLIGYLNN